MSFFRIGVIWFFFRVNIGVIIFASHCYINACVVIFNSYYSLFTNLFCSLNLQKIAKKRKVWLQARIIVSLYFGMNVAISRAYVWHPYMCWISCLEYECYGFGLVNGTRLLFYDLPRRGPVEILYRSSISPRSQTKANFKVTASR